MSDTPNNREGPQAREPSKCLNGQSYGERLAKEAFQLPVTRGSKKDSDRARTPAVEAVCVPAHLALPGSLQAKQLRHLHTQPLLGQSCHRQKKVLRLTMQGCFGHVQLFATLWTMACQTSLSGDSPGKNTGAYWPILVAIPF